MNSIESKICFGGAALSGSGGGYGFGSVENPDGLLAYAIERGVKYIDTAPIYGFGESETIIGSVIKGKRDKIRVINKCGVGWHESKRVNMSNEPGLIIKMLNDSLTRMKTEYFDAYMIHWPDPRIDIRKPLEVLLKEQEKGKILNIGLCNTNEEDIKKSRELLEVKYFQSEYNLFNNGFSNLGLNLDPYTKMGWGTFDKGILSGSVKSNSKFEKSDARSWAPWWKKSNWKEKALLCERIEKKYDISLKTMALGQSLKNCDLTLVGMKSIEQVDDICNFKNSSDPLIIEKVLSEFKSFS